MQVSHGKAQLLRRVQPGDRVAYYSPTVELRGKDKLQAFTAIGIIFSIIAAAMEAEFPD